jgi:hypothetical protein
MITRLFLPSFSGKVLQADFCLPQIAAGFCSTTMACRQKQQGFAAQQLFPAYSGEVSTKYYSLPQLEAAFCKILFR